MSSIFPLVVFYLVLCKMRRNGLLILLSIVFLAPALIAFLVQFLSGLWRVELFATPKLLASLGFFASGSFPANRSSAFFATQGIGFVWPVVVAVFAFGISSDRVRQFLLQHATRDNMRFGGFFLVAFLCHQMFIRAVLPQLDAVLHSGGAATELPAHLLLSLPFALFLGSVYLKDAHAAVVPPAEGEGPGLPNRGRFIANFFGNYLLYGLVGLTSMWGVFWFIWWVWLGPIESVGNSLNSVTTEPIIYDAMSVFRFTGFLTPITGACSAVASIVLFFAIPSSLFGLAYLQAVRASTGATTSGSPTESAKTDFPA